MKTPGFLLIFLTLVLGAGMACVALTGPAYPTPVPEMTIAPTRAVPSSSPFQIGIDGVSIGNTVIVTLTVRASGPQALLFDTPMLAGEFPTSESLEKARFDLLDLVAGGQARIVLEFPRPASDPPWVLVFNPAHTPENTVAPRVEVEIR